MMTRVYHDQCAEARALRLAFFTTSTTFGGPQTPTIEELCIESWFPLDAETEATCVALAGESVR
jgi:hypothetical protein